MAVFAFDFDGTLCGIDYPRIGEPKTKMIELAKQLKREGHQLILWTCRSGIELEKAITATGNQPVVLCSSPIRLLFRKLVERTYPQIAIMSYNEISPNIKVKSVGMIKIEAHKN